MEPNSSNPYQSYERDPRWTAVDHYAISHLHTPASSYYDALQHAAHLSTANELPDIAVSPLQGQFLAIQARLTGVKHILEVGTLGGYSTIWLASADPEIHVTTVEVDARHAEVARQAIRYAGLEDRVEILLGSGLDVLPRLREEVAAGKRPRFGFVFIDADKENGLAYLRKSVEMCGQRALLIVDNTVRKGLVADAESRDPRVLGSRAVIEAAGSDERLEATLMQTVGEKNYDGFLMCVVK